MSQKRRQCRVCGSSKTELVIYYEKAPRNIERLLDSIIPGTDESVELRVYKCEACGHVQLLNELQVDFYEDYLMTHSHVKKMQEFQKKQASEFIEKFSLRGKSFFEAGCGDGQFSLILKEMGCDVLANEPSMKARKACQKKELSTIGGYLGCSAFERLNGTFDAFVARQVLEHVPDPNAFMRGANDILKPEGVALIEVPSLEQALENDRFFDFFPDHLSYFSSVALTHLFSRNGFEVIKIKRVMDGEYNEAWIRKIKRSSFIRIQEAATNITGAFKNLFESEHARGHKVAIWGAGAKGVLALSMVDTSCVAYLIDKDPVKIGRFTPVSHLVVSAPERILKDPVDTVIITALAYKDEITVELKEKYSFKGAIYYLKGGVFTDKPE